MSVYSDKASEAMIKYGDIPNVSHALRMFCGDFGGKIVELLLVSVKPVGVSEVVIIEFKDTSRLRVSRFMNSHEGVSVTMKKL